MRRLGRVALVLVIAMLAAAPAWAAERFALVIGNQAYNDKVGPLRNPHNDAALVGKALTEVGFKLLSPRKDATREDMLFAVHDLASRMRASGRGALSFLYYAGHGIAVGGENVLVPANVESTSDAEMSVRGVRLGEILDILAREAPDAVHFVVLDACRNIRGQRGERGFVSVSDQRTGVVIAFATAAGKTATDEGPYAAALAEEIVKPGRNDQAVFNAVRVRVVSVTRGGQTPWTHDGLIGERVVFKAVPPAQPATVAAPPPAAQPRSSEAAEAWAAAKDTSNVAVLEAYVARYKDTFYADLARVRIEELKKQQVAVVMPPATVTTTPSPPATNLLSCHVITSESSCTAGDCEWVPPARDEQGKQKRRGYCRNQPVQAKPAEPAVSVLSPSRAAKPLTPAEERALKPGNSFRECDDCPEMVVVPAGSLTMGSPASEEGRDANEGPQHKVTIAKPFAVGKFEVTFAEWDACVTVGGCKHNPFDQVRGGGKRPVINVSWDNITKEYLPWLSRRAGKSYRLLTEAEWEYAARAGTTTPFSTGNTITPEQANFNGNYTYGGSAKGVNRGMTLDVGSFKPNAFGLYDMHGNVWEWVLDCWNTNYNGAPWDGSAWTTGDCSNRVLRGGSWYVNPQVLRSAGRNRYNPFLRYFDLGFRVVRTF